VDVKALKGSIVAVTYDMVEKGGFYTQIIDLSSGKKIAGWPIAAVPQSFSPDGRRLVAVAPRERNKGGVAGLQVIDAVTGAKLKSVTLGFGFKKRYPNETGGVLAQFLDNDRLIVSPDHMTDHTGNHSGYSLEIIDIVQNRIVGEIKPQYFVPAGEFVISADRTHFAAYSIYATPREYRAESPNPKTLRHELFVFNKDDPAPELIIPELFAGLPAAASKSVRLSSNGSVLAVGTHETIKVFQTTQ